MSRHALRPQRYWLLLKSRPRLFGSLAVGVLAWLLLPEAMVRQPATRVLAAWNVAALGYLALAWMMMARSDMHVICKRALRQDDGQLFVLGVAIFASLAVLVAVGSQMATVKDMHGARRIAHIVLAAGTVVVSWLFVQTTFALHYAHDFYLGRIRNEPDALQFPGTSDPTYPDFMYFACVIGTSGQTADVSFVGTPMRTLGMVHCVLAFFFNAALIGLTINIAASLF